MIVDKDYCISSFLQYRTIVDRNKCFREDIQTKYFNCDFERQNVKDSYELEKILREEVEKATANKKAALALSGGIDSAILAKMMPKGSTVYTFKCVVPNVKVTDESEIAAKYAEECGLKHEIIEIYWEDYLNYMDVLMKHKGSPIHSIEVQIYKACLKAKEDGFETLIFGESADVNFGGFNKLLSTDWSVGAFVNRFCYVLPYQVIPNYKLILEPILKYSKNGIVNFHEFARNHYFNESMGSYTNSCSCAGINFCAPFSKATMDEIDVDRVRKGENKYLVREIFERLYPNFVIPEKIPMPRPVDQWLGSWTGPTRKDLYQNCTLNMSGDQRWLVFCLERFLNLMEL